MEKLLYDAIARVIIEPRYDVNWYEQPNPLQEALNRWCYDEKNIKKLVDLVAKKIDMEKFIEDVSNKVKEKFTWRTSDDMRMDLNKMVLDKMATKLADEELQKIKDKIFIE